jgi:hypothetical protein
MLADEVGVPGRQEPFTVSLHPKVGEAPTHGLPRERSFADRLNSLQTHADNGVTVKEHGLDLSDEGSVINDSISDERQDRFPTVGYPVTRVVDGEIFRP